jgi:hypothetical protein
LKNKKLNRRDRGARGGENDQWLWVQGIKGSPFQRFPKGLNYFQKKPLRSPLPLFSSSCFHPWSIRGKKPLDSQKEKTTTTRGDAGRRSEEEIGIKSFLFFVFWKKRLCGLCDSILFFISGEDRDFFDFL